MPIDPTMSADLRALFTSQLLAVLATTSPTGPYTSLVAFVVSDDLRTLAFATARSTRKFKNMLVHRPVSLLIDNRSNRPSDFDVGLAVTVLGEAFEAHGQQRQVLRELFLARHPSLRPFVLDPATALMAVAVSGYVVVDRFQRACHCDMNNLC